MVLEWLISICLGILLFTLYENISKRRLPPGPFQFPLLGTLPQIIRSHPLVHIAFQKLSHKYGDVMLLKLGLCDAVVLSSYEAANDICFRDSVTGRFQAELLKIRTDGKQIGIAFSGGEIWKYTKRFMLRNLRDFGFGKSGSMDSVVLEQADELVERMTAEAKVSGGVISMANRFAIPTTNVIWGMVVGETVPQDDRTLGNLLEVQDQIIKSGEFGGGVSIAFPFMTKLFPNWTGKTDLEKYIRILQNYMKDILNSRRQILENNSKPTCFVDAMILEIDKNKSSVQSEFTEQHGNVLLMDLFAAGGETSSNVLGFCCLYILRHPQIQEKIHEEIDRVLKDSPTIEQKEKFPYIQAVILEVLRISTIVAVTPPRTSTEDIYYNGRLIPAGFPIMVNLYTILHDKRTWGDPEAFRPERFLSPDHKLDQKMADRVMCFGFGHRLCPGQRVGENIIFLFVTRIFQKFELRLDENHPPPTLEPKIGFALSPKPFNVRLIDREQTKKHF